MKKCKHNWQIVGIETLPTQINKSLPPHLMWDKFLSYGLFYCKKCNCFTKKRVKEIK